MSLGSASCYSLVSPLVGTLEVLCRARHEFALAQDPQRTYAIWWVMSTGLMLGNFYYEGLDAAAKGSWLRSCRWSVLRSSGSCVHFPCLLLVYTTGGHRQIAVSRSVPGPWLKNSVESGEKDAV